MRSRGSTEHHSKVPGITIAYLNVGRSPAAPTPTSFPGKSLRLDRRMIPEEDPVAVEADLRRPDRRGGGASVPGRHGRHQALPARRHRSSRDRAATRWSPQFASRRRRFSETNIPGWAHRSTDARLYAARGIPRVLYGAGPRTVLEANGHHADENLLLADLRRATKVVALAAAKICGGAA